jgi:non-heme chloroperoxidase
VLAMYEAFGRGDLIVAPSSFVRLAEAAPQRLPPVQTVVAADGCRLAFRHYATRDSGRALLLLHGAGGFGDQMHTIAETVSTRGAADVFTLDIRGHGHSGGRRGHAVRYPGQLAEDIAAVLAFMQCAVPGKHLFLGGHSAGGGLVLGLSQTPLARIIRGYVLLAPFISLNSAANRWHFGGWVAPRLGRLAILTLANVLGITGFNEATVIEFNNNAFDADRRYVPNWSFNTLLAFSSGTPGRPPRPIAAETPVLVIAGSEDECFWPGRYSGALRDIAPAAAIWEIASTGHWDLLADRAAAEAIAEWLVGPKALGCLS